MGQHSIAPIAPMLRARLVMERILEWMLAILLAAMFSEVFANVILRYFLSSTIGWYEELSCFLLIRVVFLGAVVAYFQA